MSLVPCPAPRLVLIFLIESLLHTVLRVLKASCVAFMVWTKDVCVVKLHFLACIFKICECSVGLGTQPGRIKIHSSIFKV